jgi:trigger factor
MVMDFYQKNPSAVASLRGTVYEEKIISLIKTKAKANIKEITKEEAEKILKDAHKHDHDHEQTNEKKPASTKKVTSSKKIITPKKPIKPKTAAKKTKKVSKK